MEVHSMDGQCFIKMKDRMSLFPSKIGIANIALVGKLNCSRALDPLKTHFHNDILEICYLNKGTQTYIVNNETYSLTGGDVFITLPGEIHGTGLNPEEKSTLYWVQVIMDRPENFLNLPHDYALLMFNSLMGLNSRLYKGNAKLKGYLDSFISNFFNQHPLQKVILTNTILSFLIEVINLQSENKNHQMSQDIKEISAYIRENIFEPLEIDGLARMCMLSVSRFKQKFKEQIGMPPKEYIWRQKIEVSKEMMTNATLSLTEIAVSLNFGSSQYFSEVFRKYMGMSPNEYRQTMRIT